MSRFGILIGLCFIVTAFICLVTLTLDRSSQVVVWRRHSNGHHDNGTNANKSVILLWTPFFGEPNYLPTLQEKNCKFQDCVVTSDKKLLNVSSAVVFHILETSLTSLPSYRSAHQAWLLFVLESPLNTGMLMPFNRLFNWTATYRMDSDIWTPYDHVMKLDQNLQLETKNYWKGKSKLVSWFNSNCNTGGGREQFVEELQKYIKVDVYGSCGKLHCHPKMSFQCYEKVAREYFFYFSFENSICKDYVTEKFFHILKFDLVPVVFGGANYSAIAPPGSYIDALSFESPKALAEHLKRVSKNETLYNSYFAWRKTHALGGYHWVCELCKKLRTGGDGDEMLHKSYSDLDKWWRTDAQCRTWTTTGLKPI